jgi:hypothetical protein
MRLLLNASDLARLLKVNRATIIRKIKLGEIPGAQQEAGRKEWLIPLSAYEELIKKKL